MADMNGFAVYSLQDVAVTFNHPDIGQSKIGYDAGYGYAYKLSEASRGRVVISYSADMSSHTTSAGGYVVVNKITAHAGTVALQMPQNSDGDLFLRKWCNYLKTANVKRFALGSLTITDYATGQTYQMRGVTPQKIPDISYDQAAGTVQYTLLCAYVQIKNASTK